VSISSDRIWLEKVLESELHFATSGEASIRSSSIAVEVWEDGWFGPIDVPGSR
jgi:hypothetical protein